MTPEPERVPVPVSACLRVCGCPREHQSSAGRGTAAPGCDNPAPHPDPRRPRGDPTPCSVSRVHQRGWCSSPTTSWCWVPSSAYGGHVLVSLPWWHLAVILCPRCPCLQRPFACSGGTWSPLSVLATCCLGGGCCPTAAPLQPVRVPLGATGVGSRPRAVPQCLGPLACGRHSQGGVRGTGTGQRW